MDQHYVRLSCGKSRMASSIVQYYSTANTIVMSNKNDNKKASKLS